MTEPLKIGIIGLGKMGGIRAKTVQENDDTVLISGTDPNPPSKGFEDMQILPNYEAVINFRCRCRIRLYAKPFHSRYCHRST